MTTEPDTSWIGVPLPGNEAMAKKARALAEGALKATGKVGYLRESLASKRGAGSDPDGVAVATVDFSGRVASTVFEERKWRELDQDRAERAAQSALNAALADLRAKRQQTEAAFFGGFGMENMPTLDDLRQEHGGEDSGSEPAAGRGSDPEALVTVVVVGEDVTGVVFNRQRFGALTREQAGKAVTDAANKALADAQAKTLTACKQELENQGLGDLLDPSGIFAKLFPEQTEEQKQKQRGGPR
ncbi:hypothetical protein [Segniliparus rugosus]|uniref:YbaB/EbfC DNA-binding family protein n=1 Tax=Segniliparus rugosus (strain ATCC BAA-974 / DSM 45345 / CCUG 50838 / CIP 108380 / JCM 13579 / CDC 945) TaxID=679197 RepID=E5XLP9_SEGRC|nr:hypothetical protein [Segniliparus rugosus]EFV14727.1 hypothetical protein HMPREF9336_00418 [Segniliparus rugosus ATCC BAA-974]